MLWCSLFVTDLLVGMEELELHNRRRGRSNFHKIRIATISVRMVTFFLDLRVFLYIFEICAEDCFLLGSFQKCLPPAFLPLSRFQGNNHKNV